MDVGSFTFDDVFAQVEPKLTTLENKMPHELKTTLRVEEFCSKCPLTGFPDYAKFDIAITVPAGGKMVEQKALRVWLNKFTDVDAYQEEITAAVKQVILNSTDLKPEQVRVVAYWKGRGGISAEIVV